MNSAVHAAARIMALAGPSYLNDIAGADEFIRGEADSIRGAQPKRLLSGTYRSADGGRTWKWMSTTRRAPEARVIGEVPA